MDLPEKSSESGVPAEPSGAHLRASDADRDQVADRLREALAEGRITPEEHAERIDAVYRAKTYAELAPVLSDLPSQEAPRPVVEPLPADPVPAPPPAQSPNLVAIFSGVARKGRWLVEPTTNVTCVFGGADLDFRQAVLSAGEVTINVNCVFGGVNMIVPPGVRVIASNTAIFGGNDLPEDDTTDPDAPVIRVTGTLLFGGVSVKRKAVDDKGGRRDRHRLHGARHGEAHTELHEARDARRERLQELRDARRRDH
ncbi:cell wall-active antibiotic response 4TMS protein YvqF [Actinomadura pelletieri DSM 43383]|uniref:Cell wall-active antibiotic response 4TMS protein YvqF n=1 Tax=Actinomadura pelletieri DSM 43383 TaxID=1120940 RepID=A0A495QND5_9ACTN|nr:cell wall-active antibiotic response 4TMS protein YvqF [Actinomadura pelletieri DSM 43383]